MEKKPKPSEDTPYVEEASVPGDNDPRTALDPALVKQKHRPAETQGRPEDVTKP